MEIQSLFPVALGMFELGRDFTSEEIKFIKNQETHDNMGNNTTSVNKNILDHVELQNIRYFVENAIAEYFKKVYAPKQDTKLRITQSWCNYTEPGQFHHKHSHPNSFVSGVLYPQANKSIDKIYFYRDGYQQLKTPTAGWNLYNADSWWMEAYTGRMFIFPSSLMHMVETVQGNDQRISLSFNTFPKGDFGDAIAAAGLGL